MRYKLYVAGPMTGLPGLNYESFQEAKVLLGSGGYDVRDPSEIDAIHAAVVPSCRVCQKGTHPWTWYMRMAIGMMLVCDAVAVLPNWEQSRGARMEVDLASKLDMPFATVDTWYERRRTVMKQFASKGYVDMS